MEMHCIGAPMTTIFSDSMTAFGVVSEATVELSVRYCKCTGALLSVSSVEFGNEDYNVRKSLFFL